jgi:hypothetical protein
MLQALRVGCGTCGGGGLCAAREGNTRRTRGVRRRSTRAVRRAVRRVVQTCRSDVSLRRGSTVRSKRRVRRGSSTRGSTRRSVELVVGVPFEKPPQSYRVKQCELQSTQGKSSRVKSSQATRTVSATRSSSAEVKPSQVESSQANSSQLKSSQATRTVSATRSSSAECALMRWRSAMLGK